MHIARIVLMAGAIAVALCAQALAQKREAGDADLVRPGGVYSSLIVADPDSCSNLCAADGLCLAWTFLPGGACELKAVAPVRATDTAELRALTPAPLAAAATEAAPEHINDADTLLLGGAGDDDAPGMLRPRLGAAGTR